MRSTLLFAAALCLATSARAQHVHPSSSYAGEERRAIKALSAEELQQLAQGEGMGLALAAELNHHPGPRHALELAHGLGLTADQIRDIERIREAMNQEARRLGERIIEQERALDAAFAGAVMDEAALERLTGEIASLRGRLRFTHLRAHLEVRSLLTTDQVRRYDALRGYQETGRSP